jgi:hypothetical protein
VESLYIHKLNLINPNYICLIVFRIGKKILIQITLKHNYFKRNNILLKLINTLYLTMSNTILINHKYLISLSKIKKLSNFRKKTEKIYNHLESIIV